MNNVIDNVKAEIVKLQRESLIDEACRMVTNADYLEQVPVGTTFDLSILKDERAESGRVVLDRVLDQVSWLKLGGMIDVDLQFEVVFHAKGAAQDLICKVNSDRFEGEFTHVCIPSGVVLALHRMEAGDFPPELPKVPEVSTSRTEEKGCAIH